MSNIRWWLFKKISALGWIICPQPHKTNLQRSLYTWTELDEKNGHGWEKARLKEAE